MPNQELEKYITAARNQGLSDEVIREQLIRVGWPENQVSQALATQPEKAPEVPKTPSSPATPVGQTKQPTTQTPQTTTPPAATPQVSPSPFPSQPPTIAGPATSGPTRYGPGIPGVQETPGGSFQTTRSPLSNLSNLVKTHWLKIVIGLAVILIIIGGVILAQKLFMKKSEESSNSTKVPQASSKSESKPQEKIFDVPAILNKTPAEVKAILGTPDGDGMGYVSYEKYDYYLDIYYDIDTKAFRYVSVQVPQDPAKPKDQKTIFKALNLVEGSDKYIIKLDKSTMNQMIIGVRVYPAGSKDYSLED